MKTSQEKYDEARKGYQNSPLVSFLRLLVDDNIDFKKEQITAEGEDPFRTEVTLLRKDIVFEFGPNGTLVSIFNEREKRTK